MHQEGKRSELHLQYFTDIEKLNSHKEWSKKSIKLTEKILKVRTDIVVYVF